MNKMSTAYIINGYTNEKDVIITLNTELGKIVIRETLGFKDGVSNILKNNGIDITNITQSSIKQTIEYFLGYVIKKMGGIEKGYTSESYELGNDDNSIKSSITVMEAN